VLVLLVVAAAAVLLADVPAAVLLPVALLLLPAAALARDRSRSLGHALVEGHVVARSGSLVRRREVLGVGHVISWTVRDTWFQRRQGLVTLEATTAGGRQRVTVLDVPEGAGLDLTAGSTPGLLAAFVLDGR
jgi:putative membrane protein